MPVLAYDSKVAAWLPNKPADWHSYRLKMAFRPIHVDPSGHSSVALRMNLPRLSHHLEDTSAPVVTPTSVVNDKLTGKFGGFEGSTQV